MTETLNSDWVQQQQRAFENTLQHYLPTGDTRLHRAMRYSTLDGGKRLRPLLVYACGSCFAATYQHLNPVAVAIELIHCYSLVHDDLPAMDDDDLRRGRPSCHKQFDEATAILVGDALQSLAFDVLSRHDIPNQIKIIQTLATASGSFGMAGGQSLDMDATNNPTTLTELKTIHQQKTGALIRAAVRMGALTSGHCSDKELRLLDTFAQHFGLAFQIRDDILDVESDTQALGKTAGKDASQNKATYPALLGLAESRAQLQRHRNQLNTLLDQLEFAQPLEQLVNCLS